MERSAPGCHTPGKNTSSRAIPAFISYDFHESYESERRRALFLVTGGRVGAGDKRQIPTAGDELPKRRGRDVKEGRAHTTLTCNEGSRHLGYLRDGGKKGGLCVACRLSSSYISLEIPRLARRIRRLCTHVMEEAEDSYRYRV